MPGIVVDIGTGSGRFVYELAKQHPDRLFIGIDPNHKNLEKNSLKASKKPPKGGLPNVLYVLASMDDLPSELNGIVNQVFINFPWAALLKGIVRVEEKEWHSLKRICRTGAQVEIVLGYNQYVDLQKDKLQPISKEYVYASMAPKLLMCGFSLNEVQQIDGSKLRRYPSDWAKKLGYGRDRTFFYISLTAG